MALTLRERVGRWIGGARDSTEPIAFNPKVGAFFGSGVGHQPTHQALLRESIGVADRATRAIANRIATLNPQVKTARRVDARTTRDEVLDEHPLKVLLDRPHPDFTRMQLLRLTTQYIVTVGEAYWLKVGNGLGVPAELHPIPPWMIHPVLDTGIVTSYVVETGSGEQRSLPREVVVRFYFPDPESPWTSEGYLGPSGITADSLKFSAQHLRAHYQNDASPKTVLKAGEHAETFGVAERERFWTDWRRRYQSRVGTEQGAPAILPTGYDLVSLAMQTGAEVVPLLEYWRDEMLMDFGTPRSVLGQVVSGDRSSAETNQYVFDLHTIKPLATLLSDGITSQLAPDFDESIFVTFEEFVSHDKDFRLREEQADLQGKVRTVNHVRVDRGLEEVEWGDDPVGTIADVPYDGEGSFFDTPDPDDDEPSTPQTSQAKTAGKFDEGEAITGSSVLNGAQVASIVQLVEGVASGVLGKSGSVELMGVAFGIEPNVAAKIIGDPTDAAADTTNDEQGRVRSVLRAAGVELEPGGYSGPDASFFIREVAWVRQVKMERKFIPPFIRGMQFILRKQRESVLSRLRQPRARIDVTDIFDEDEWGELFALKVESVRARAFNSITREVLGALGADPPGNFQDEMRKILRAQGADLVSKVQATTKAKLRRQLEVAVQKGESLDAIAKRISRVFSVRRKEALRIAHTEVLKASQQATLQGYAAADVVHYKRWNTSVDPRVRDSHQPANNQTVLKSSPFVLGDGELSDAPGLGHAGSPLSAGNAINCRCFLTPVLEGE